MITVTKAYLPDLQEVNKRLLEVWGSGQLTNNGLMLKTLEDELRKKLDVRYLQCVTNGTIAIQLLIKAFNLSGKVLTTPFSYVATSNALLWEKCTPVFIDITPNTLNVDASQIERYIEDGVTGMLFTHVFGIPCDVERIHQISQKYNLPVIYDAAHAFGVKYKNAPLITYGDASTLSFHATKIFHSVEGGAVVVSSEKKHEEVFLLKSFGHIRDEYYSEGINGKNSEIHSAIGLCVLDKIDEIMLRRKDQWLNYFDKLRSLDLTLIDIPESTEYNYSYFPVIFKTEEQLHSVVKKMQESAIYPRRYFYPSLNKLPFLKQHYSCPVSESISMRILCLPLYHELSISDQYNVVRIIQSCL